MTQLQQSNAHLEEVLHLPKPKCMITFALFVRLGTKGIMNEIDYKHVEEAINNSRQCYRRQANRVVQSLGWASRLHASPLHTLCITIPPPYFP